MDREDWTIKSLQNGTVLIRGETQKKYKPIHYQNGHNVKPYPEYHTVTLYTDKEINGVKSILLKFQTEEELNQFNFKEKEYVIIKGNLEYADRNLMINPTRLR